MSDPKQMYSLSFLSSDAKRVDDGYQFTLKSAIARVKPTRVMLASIELPLSQQSIEEKWSRVHFRERVQLATEFREFRLMLRYEDTDEQKVIHETLATLPLQKNEISEARMNTSTRILSVTCDEKHGLFVANRCILAFMRTWGDAGIIGCESGSFSLHEACQQGRLIPIDDYTFGIKIPDEESEPQDSDAGVVYIPGPPSLTALASLLTSYIELSPVRRLAFLSYLAEENRMAISLSQYPEDATSVSVTVGGDRLLHSIGFTPGVTRTFHKSVLDAGTLPSGEPHPSLATQELMLVTGNHGTQASDIPPLVMKSQTMLWPHIRLSRGHYAPTKKSHTPSPPQRIQTEIDVQFNRFLLRRRDDGSSPAIVFVDPAGMAHIAELTPGMYSADGLATTMTQVMSDAGSATFTVAFSGNAFTFACVNSGLLGSPRTFSLLFGHPRAIEARRIGFDEITYDGSNIYTSSYAISIPNMHPHSSESVPHTNLYQLSEDASRARMRFVSIAPPPVIGVITGLGGALLTIDCFASGRPVSHGFAIGTVVTITSPGKSFEINGVETLPADPGYVRGVVAEHPTPHVVILRVHSSLWISEKGRVVALSVPVEPFSLCFHPSLENTVGHRLGYDARAYEYGYDGITQSSEHGLLPPFYASGVYDLDHPDFVLMYLHEGKRTSLTHHYSAGTASLPFAKIVLYPVYREERALMRETVLSSGEGMNRFTIDLRNPDGTRYELNGARFSFTLNFIQ